MKTLSRLLMIANKAGQTLQIQSLEKSGILVTIGGFQWKYSGDNLEMCLEGCLDSAISYFTGKQ